MWMYSVTSRLAKLAYAPTYTFVAANVEDAARQTYAKWSADVGGAFTSAEVTILKIEMGENPCEHMEGLEEEEE